MGFAELQQRHELIGEVRGRGLMIGSSCAAPSSRVARLNWRLIHLASEGLFPQLIVIPLHRDHGVITMAAGKNDVIKLLPPLTLSEPEARSFLEALDTVLADCHGAASRNWAVVRGHRHRDAPSPTRARRTGAPMRRHSRHAVDIRGAEMDEALHGCICAGLGGRFRLALDVDARDLLGGAQSDTARRSENT